MITLKPFEKADLPQLNQWIANAQQLLLFSGDYFTFPIDENQIIHYLSDKQRLAFQVLHNKIPIGHAELYQENHQQARLCRILLSEGSRGQGLGKQCIQALLTHCFDDLDLHTVHLNVFDWNLAAIKCYEKCGFQITPTPKKSFHHNDEIWQTINMSITKTSWTQDN